MSLDLCFQFYSKMEYIDVHVFDPFRRGFCQFGQSCEDTDPYMCNSKDTGIMV